MDGKYQIQYRANAGCDWVDIDDADVSRDIIDQCLATLDDDEIISEVVLAHVGQYRAIVD